MDLMMMRRAIIMGQPTGPAPEFYNKLVFDGTAFIQTDYVIPELGSIAILLCGYEKVQAPQNIFFIPSQNDATIGTGVVLANGTSSSGRTFAGIYDCGSWYTTPLRFTYTSYSLFMTPKRYGYGNASKVITKGSTSPGTGICFGGGRSTNTPFTGSFETVTIYDSTAQDATQFKSLTAFTPVATFRPCLYEGEAGLWHVEGRRFYGNTAGAGTLTVSND